MTVDMDPAPPSAPYLDIEKGTADILRLFHEYGVKATFFVTASVALDFPEMIQEIRRKGHEIACHGLKHDANEAMSSIDEQCRTIRTATEEIESIAGSRPIGFRAPLFRSNANCRVALHRNDYVYDSSVVCSPFYGSYKTRLLSRPFFLSCSGSRADCNLLEIPVSVNPFMPFPLGGSFMRIFGLNWIKIGIRTNSMLNAPIVFYVHPKDVILRTSGIYWHSYRNTANCLRMLEEIILYGKKIRAEFMRACELAEAHLGIGKNEL
jgi:peptidoglycan/xylan/chitin deacetylase (PgdA/CDA1 family)